MQQYSTIASGISLTAATAKTVVQVISPSTRRGKITNVIISGASTTSTDGPILVQFVRQTTAGTVTAYTPKALDPVDPASLFTAGVNATVEPTSGNVLKTLRVTPIGGLVIIPTQTLQDLHLTVSDRLGIVLTAPTSITNVEVTVEHQE